MSTRVTFCRIENDLVSARKPGARAVTAGKGPEWGLALATPVIVKYRDSRTDTRTELEAWIR